MLINKTKNSELASKIKICTGLLATSRGLMFRKLKDSEAIVLNLGYTSHAAIHTFFVFYPIDVLWLNKEYEVVDLQENVRPFRFWLSPKNPAYYIVELPAGTIKQGKTSVGDEIKGLI